MKNDTCAKCKIPESKMRIANAECKAQKDKSKMGMRDGIPKWKCTMEMQDSECKIQSANPECKI